MVNDEMKGMIEMKGETMRSQQYLKGNAGGRNDGRSRMGDAVDRVDG
jgi:hypothetical protein